MFVNCEYSMMFKKVYINKIYLSLYCSHQQEPELTRKEGKVFYCFFKQLHSSLVIGRLLDLNL